MFKFEWKTPHHNILVEFLNNWKLDPKHNKIKVMLGDEQRITDKNMSWQKFKNLPYMKDKSKLGINV